MKVFISQPMYGKKTIEVERVQTRIVRKLVENGYTEFEVIDNYNKKNVPEGAGRLWYLGDSIKLMDQADLIIFADDWDDSKGCLSEFRIARLYNKKFKFEEDLDL